MRGPANAGQSRFVVSKPVLFGEELEDRRAERLAGLDLGEVSDARELDIPRVRQRVSDQTHRDRRHDDIELTGDHERRGGDLLASSSRSSPSSISAYITQTESQFIGAAQRRSRYALSAGP